MIKKSKKKKNILQSRFYQVYFALVALALIAIVIGTVWLTGYLKDVEASQPVYVAQQVAQLFENADYESIYTMDTTAREISESDKDFYIESLKALTSGRNVAWEEGFSSDGDQKKYNVTLDGDRFASFTLVPSGLKSRRGNRLWTLGSVTTNVSLQETPQEGGQDDQESAEAEAPEQAAPAGLTCRITAPKGYTVTVDSVNLDAQNSSVTETALFPANFLPSDVTPPMMVEYTYIASGMSPQVLVTDASGQSVQPSQAGEGVWSVAMPENQEFRSVLSDAGLKLGKNIARFTSKDGNKGAILKYCARNSPAYSAFDNLSNQYATPHSDVMFQNEQVTEVYQLSENCFTCRVSFDYLMKTREGVRTDPTAYTFCIIRDGGTGKLYNLLMG